MTINYENYDLSFPDQPVVDLYLPVWASLPAFRDKPAFIWTHDDDIVGPKSAATATVAVKTTKILTYSQLNDSVRLISAQLLLRLQRRDTVLVLCRPGLDLVGVIFGCQRAGLVSVPMFPPRSSFDDDDARHHLARVISQTRPKAAIAHPDYIASVCRYISSSSSSSNLAKFARLLEEIYWISTEDIKMSLKREPLDPVRAESCGPDEVYLVQYTSGATGLPKPVLITAGSAVHNVRVARKAYDLHPNSVVASWLPQYHDCGLQFLLLTVVAGATCVLTSPFAFLRRPRIWLEMISDFGATCSPVPSFTLPLVLKRGGGATNQTDPDSISLDSLKNLILINEPIYKSAVDEFAAAFEKSGLRKSSIAPSYGLAENCTFVSTAWRDGGLIELPCHGKLLPSAVLSPESDDDMEIVVVNEETGELVGDGVEGEIWISSPSNCSGYLGHPSMSREICQARLKDRTSRLCFLRSGDRGVVVAAGSGGGGGREDRYLYVTGRCSDVIRVAGRREVHPHYIETAAQRSSPDFIRGGCLAGFALGNVVVLVVELQRKFGGKDGGIVLRRICEGIRKGVWEEEKVEVGKVVLVKSGSVPKTTSGKVRRWAAKEKLVAREMSVLVEVTFDVKICEVERREKSSLSETMLLGFGNYQHDSKSLVRSHL